MSPSDLGHQLGFVAFSIWKSERRSLKMVKRMPASPLGSGGAGNAVLNHLMCAGMHGCTLLYALSK